MALTSITVTTGTVVEGRALARNGQVSLDTNVFTTPECGGELPPGGESPDNGEPRLPDTGISVVGPLVVVGALLLNLGLLLIRRARLLSS